MSKLTKIMHKIFGINADFSYQMGKFGSFKNGSPQYAANIVDIQSLPNWETGLFDSVVANNAPLKEDINSALHHSSRQLGYLYQAGIPEWDTDTVYYINSFVSYEGELFVSLIDTNAGQIPNIANASKWAPVTSKNIFVDYVDLVGQSVPTLNPAMVFNFPTKTSDGKNLVQNAATNWAFVAPYDGYYEACVDMSSSVNFANADRFSIFMDVGGNTEILKEVYFNGSRTLEETASKKIKAMKGDLIQVRVSMARAAGNCDIFGKIILNKTDF